MKYTYVPLTYYNDSDMPIVKLGDLGETVNKLQMLLISRGIVPSLYQESKLKQFGPVTEAAVKQFQIENGLKVDGVVGPETLRALNGNGDTLNGFFAIPDYDGIHGELPRKILELADKAFRANVREIPYGSNRGPLVSDEVGGVDAYLSWHGSRSYVMFERVEPSLNYPNDYKGAPWCAAFAAWLLKKSCDLLQVSSPLIGHNDLMSDSKWLHAAKLAQKVTAVPQAGNVGLLGESPTNLRHLVLIANVIDDKIFTREGNSRGQRVSALVRDIREVQWSIDLSI